jgi:protein-S-isoprenylcysteine O-methyltransferase Ste14
MMRSPIRSFSFAGIIFGVFVLVIGILFLLVNQGVIPIRFDLWTVCSLLLVMLGFLIIGGSIYAHRSMRGRWRRWAEGFEKDF